jgi:hypothetical protein
VLAIGRNGGRGRRGQCSDTARSFQDRRTWINDTAAAKFQMRPIVGRITPDRSGPAA